MSNVIKRMSARLMMLAAMCITLSVFTACSDDDEKDDPLPPSQPKIEVGLEGNTSFSSFTSTGSFELTVKLTGVEGTPKAENFTLSPATESVSNLIYDWDEISPEEEAPLQEIKPLAISAVEAGDTPDVYRLTIDYDATGNMIVSWSDIHVSYEETRSRQTFSFSYEGIAQNSVAMPLQTAKKSTEEFWLDIREGFEALEIEYKEYQDSFGSHGTCSFYVGLESDSSLSFERTWPNYPDAVPGLGSSYTEDAKMIPMINIKNPSALEAGQIYYLHVVVLRGGLHGKGEYAAIHVPVLIEE